MSTNFVNKDTGELVTLANGTRMWVGTKSAHDLAVQQGTMPNNCMVCITDDAAGEEAWQYSTEETRTGSTWIDGKPIYRKVITGTTPSSEGGVLVASILNISNVIKLYGTLEQRSNGILQNQVPLNTYWSDTVRIATMYSHTLNGIYMKALGVYQNMPFRLVIEYTKTTD